MKRSQGRAAQTAERVITDYAIRSPDEIDVEAIAMDQGLFVKQGPLAGSWARLVRKGTGGLIRVSDSVTLEGQKRFCVAHEIGHFLLHSEVNQLEFCTLSDMLPGYARRPEEPEASAFAGELLMPETMLRARLEPSELSLLKLESLANEFQVTMSATIHRVVDVGVHVCALVRSEGGRIRSFHLGADFPFRIRDIGAALDGCSCAGEFFRDGSVGEKEADVAAEAWLDDRNLLGSETVRELTVPMPNYGNALTLLWIVPGSELDYQAAEGDEEG
jgi:hypothetical protein